MLSTVTKFIKVVLIKVSKNMIMSAKFTTPGLLKIIAFLSKGYEFITLVHDVINKTCYVNQTIVNVVM